MGETLSFAYLCGRTKKDLAGEFCRIQKAKVSVVTACLMSTNAGMEGEFETWCRLGH